MRLADERFQSIVVDEDAAECLHLKTIVATPSDMLPLKTPLANAWRRNRLSELIGFDVDSRGRMIAEAWVPLAGLNAAEWEFYVLSLARAADRFEYLISGTDRH